MAAEPVFQVAAQPDRILYLQLPSIRRLDGERVGFSLELVSSRAYVPTGATEPVAIEVTDYVLDCGRNRWEERGPTRYMSDEDKEVGHASSIANNSWQKIASGSELETVRKKICSSG